MVWGWWGFEGGGGLAVVGVLGQGCVVGRVIGWFIY